VIRLYNQDFVASFQLPVSLSDLKLSFYNLRNIARIFQHAANNWQQATGNKKRAMKTDYQNLTPTL
jgi:hypothetical protein